MIGCFTGLTKSNYNIKYPLEPASVPPGVHASPVDNYC